MLRATYDDILIAPYVGAGAIAFVVAKGSSGGAGACDPEVAVALMSSGTAQEAKAIAADLRGLRACCEALADADGMFVAVAKQVRRIRPIVVWVITRSPC